MAIESLNGHDRPESFLLHARTRLRHTEQHRRLQKRAVGNARRKVARNLAAARNHAAIGHAALDRRHHLLAMRL